MTESTIKSAITPPRAQQVVGRKTKLGRKLPKLVSPQSFREDVGCLKIGADVLKVDIPYKDTFLDEVVVYLNVLCPSMEDEISGKTRGHPFAAASAIMVQTVVIFSTRAKISS